jgi:hypothetical protein
VQHHPTDQLDVEWPHAQGPHRSLSCDGKCFRQYLIKRLTIRNALLEFSGFAGQLVVTECLQALFERVDTIDSFRVLLEQPLISAAENSGYETRHRGLLVKQGKQGKQGKQRLAASDYR